MTTKTPFKRRGSFNSSNQVCERPNNFPPLYAMVSVKNTGMQSAKKSRFTPEGIYGPLETTLVQFNAWLVEAYRRAAQRI